MSSTKLFLETAPDTISLRSDVLYDIGGKVLSLAEIQQAVIDQDCYAQLRRDLK